MKIRAVVFDWAGTIVDFGSLAPMGAFVRLFANHGISITIEQARIPMGLPKLAHIEALGALPEIGIQWQATAGAPFSASDAASLLLEFEPMSAQAAFERKAFVPGFMDTYNWLNSRDIGVATTTGYTRKIMAPLISYAQSEGFYPALVICCDDVAQSRPSPMGMVQCMQALGVSETPQFVVKVDDTAPGLQEGLNAGCWTVGVAASGNALGWSLAQWEQSSEDERATPLATARKRLADAGAHEVIDSVADLGLALANIEVRIQQGEQP